MQIRTVNETTLSDQGFGEYSWVESSATQTDCPTIQSYLDECDVQNWEDVTSEYSGRIHNQPTDAVIVRIKNGEYSESLHMLWFETYEAAAEQRVNNTPELSAHRDILIDYLWDNQQDHLQWVATASIDEILAWCKDVKSGEGEAK